MRLSLKAIIFFIAAAFVVLLGIIFSFSTSERVSEGHVSVVYTPAGGAKEVLQPGWHFYTLGLLDKTYEFSVRPEVIKTSVDVNTSDGKKVIIPVTYNLRIDEGSALSLFKLYGARGESYYSDTVIQQQLHKFAKETISQFSTIDIFTTKMSTAGDEIAEKLSKAVQEKGFFISELALLSPELDAGTQAAIDAQVKAQTDNELKKYELENDKIDQKKAQQQAEADQLKSKTEADTKSYNVKAAADAQAYANEVLAKSLTENILKKMEYEARLKHGWVTIQGQNTVVTDK